MLLNVGRVSLNNFYLLNLICSLALQICELHDSIPQNLWWLLVLSNCLFELQFEFLYVFLVGVLLWQNFFLFGSHLVKLKLVLRLLGIKLGLHGLKFAQVLVFNWQLRLLIWFDLVLSLRKLQRQVVEFTVARLYFVFLKIRDLLCVVVFEPPNVRFVVFCQLNVFIVQLNV